MAWRKSIECGKSLDGLTGPASLATLGDSFSMTINFRITFVNLAFVAMLLAATGSMFVFARNQEEQIGRSEKGHAQE
jgi:hypothetical protein